MAHYPGADWRPLAADEAHQGLMSRHDIVCLHTMVGTLDGTDTYFHQDGYGGTESHFGVGGDGRIFQWTDTDRMADANLDGNPRVLSIETEDMGPDFPQWTGSNVPAWTDAQIEAICQVTAWACKKYDIPAALIPDTLSTRRGIGYHRQGIEGSWTDGSGYVRGEHWSTSTGKTCPGDRRIQQLKERVIPRVREILNGDDMSAADVKAINEQTRQAADRVIGVINARFEGQAKRLKAQTAALRAAIDNQASPAEVKELLNNLDATIQIVVNDDSTEETPA